MLKGYQADIDFANQFTGMIYEERGRGFLMQRGQAIEIGPDGVSRQIGILEMTADELKTLIKAGEWNTVHLIARGNTIVNIVNGHVTALYRGRRSERSRDEGAARLPDPRRGSDEDRVPEYLSEDVCKVRRSKLKVFHLLCAERP